MTENTKAEAAASPRASRNANADDLAEIDLVGLMMAVLRRWKLCAAICGVIVAAGLAYCFGIATTQYQTTSRLYVDTGRLQTTAKDEVQFVLADNVLSKIYRDFKFGETKAFAGVEKPMRKFRSLYDVKEVPKSSLIEISFKDPNVERSAAVNAATAQAYIEAARERVRQVLKKESTVLETILAQREKERDAATAELEAFKSKHGIMGLDIERSQTLEELNRVGAAAADTPLMAQSGGRVAYTAQPRLSKAAREKLEQDREALAGKMSQLDALGPEYQAVSARYNLAQGNYQAAYSAVQAEKVKLQQLEGDALARVVVPASTDEDNQALVKKTPAKAKVMAVLVLAALVLSVLVCVVLELLDRTLKTRGEFERAGGVDVLGEAKKTEANEEVWRKTAAMTKLGCGTHALVIAAASPLTMPVSAAASLKAVCEKAGKVVRVATMAEWAGAVESAMRTESVVLLETAPLSESADALTAADVSGVKTLLVGELYQTKREELVEAVAMLDRIGADIAGAVVLAK